MSGQLTTSNGALCKRCLLTLKNCCGISSDAIRLRIICGRLNNITLRLSGMQKGGGL
jgi:hypothetical protein